MSRTPRAAAHSPGPGSITAARSLADWLRGWTDDELHRLIQLRPDLVLPVPQDTSVLALRASERTHVARALDHLDAFTLSVVDRILLSPAPMSRTAVDEATRQALDRLSAAALVWGTTELTPVSGLAAAVERPAGLGRPLATLLRFADRTAVSNALGAHGIPRGDTDESAGRLARILIAAIADLTAEEREVLGRVDQGGSIGVVADALVPADPADPSPVRRLLARGFFLPVDPTTVEIPREVGLALRGANPFPLVSPLPPELVGDQTPRSDADEEAALVASNAVRLVALFLAEWAKQPVAELKTGGVSQRDLKTLSRVLGVQEERSALLIETARAAGLVGRTTSLDASFAPTARYDEWLRRDAPGRWTELAAAWLISPIAPSLLGRRNDGGKVAAPLGGGAYHRLVRDLRRAVLLTLAESPVDQAPSRTSVLTRLTWLSPRLFGLDIGSLLDDVLNEAAFLGITAGGRLARYARPLLDEDAESASQALSAALPEPIDFVLLQADLTAVAPGLLAPALADDLAVLADIESPGGATVYRFSDRTIRRALDVGWDAVGIAHFLTGIGRPAVPQALSYLVEDTARRHGRLRVGSAGGYIRCDDEALLTEVVADRRCGPLRLRRIAPTVAVSPLGVSALLDQLRSAGYAPVGERPDGSINLTRSEGVRAARAIPLPMGERPADERTIARIVAGMRAGDRTRTVATGTPLRDRGISASIDLLERAIEEQRPIVLGYINAQGRDSRRVVEPERLSNGLLTAYDHQTQARRSFALSRITELGLADEGGA